MGVLRQAKRYGVAPDQLGKLWPQVAEALGLTLESVDESDYLAVLIRPAAPGVSGESAARYQARFTPALNPPGVTAFTLTLNDPLALDGSEKLEVAARDFFTGLEKVMTGAGIDLTPPPAELVLTERRSGRPLLWAGAIFAVMVIMTVLSFAGVFSHGVKPKLAPVSQTPGAPPPPPKETKVENPPTVTVDQAKGSVVKIETAKGDIVLELNDKDAPVTAGNFLLLAESGFYNGLTFHRVVPDFVVQGGDPKGTGGGGPGFRIPDEVKPGMKLETGSLSMAKTSDPDTAGSQFFIVTGSASAVEHLNGTFTIFGRVIQGMDVVRKISVGDVMKKVTVVKDSPDAEAAKKAAKAARIPLK